MAVTLISGPAEISYTRNPINIKVQLEADLEYTDVYALCTIYSSLTDIVAILYARPDDDYHAEFDISSVLDSINNFSIPDITVTHEKITDFVKSYWCSIQQYDDGSIHRAPLNVGRTGDTITLFSIKGGLSQEKISTDIFSLFTTRKMFLTWLTESKVIEAQKHYLYYLHQNGDENLLAKVEVYYSDGTECAETTLYDFGTVSKYNLLKIACGFDQQSIGNIEPTKTAIYYKVWLETKGSSSKSPVLRAGNYTFTLSNDYVPFSVYITNANSLGGFDFIVMKGNITSGITPDSKEFEQINSSGHNISSFNHTIEKNRKAATGYISKNRLDILSDIFLTKERYEILNSVLIKIHISNKSKLEYNEIDNLFGMILEYRRSYVNKNFTPDVIS